MNQNTNQRQELYQAALVARRNAYAPYSQFQVGAALKLNTSSEIFTGCNVENISYGATICAERTAVVKAISVEPKGRIEELALVTDAVQFDCPCGMCLQVLSEFCSPDTPIHLCNLKGIQKTVAFRELMPFQFENKDVKK